MVPGIPKTMGGTLPAADVAQSIATALSKKHLPVWDVVLQLLVAMFPLAPRFNFPLWDDTAGS
jgi:hypothetical protein